jgi:hypothetical protein
MVMAREMEIGREMERRKYLRDADRDKRECTLYSTEECNIDVSAPIQ